MGKDAVFGVNFKKARQPRPTGVSYKELIQQRDQLLQTPVQRSGLLEQHRQWQQEQIKAIGKPLNRVQNTAATRMRYLSDTMQPIRKEDFHKATFDALLRKGYVKKEHGRYILKIRRPLILRMYTKTQQLTKDTIYGKPQPKKINFNAVLKDLKRR